MVSSEETPIVRFKPGTYPVKNHPLSREELYKGWIHPLDEELPSRKIIENDVKRWRPEDRPPDEVEIWVEDLHEKGSLKASEGSVERRGDLPWSQYIWQQCKAVREPRGTGSSHYGRCELHRDHEGIDHALERGMDIPRWSTNWTA